MKKTLTRLFTVALLLMVSLGARAEVKVLFGVNGTELQPDKDGKVTLGQKELTGGTVIISQENQKNGTTELTLAVTPDKGYRLAENGLEVYTVAPADISQTRTVKASTKLDIKSEDFKDEASKRTYTATIDSNLALWLKSANFLPQKKNVANRTESNDAVGLYYIKIGDVYVWRAIAEKSIGQPYLSGLKQTSAYTDPNTGTKYGTANCTWCVREVDVDDNTYYVFINVATNQYVVWDTYNSGTGMAVHLETRASEPTQSSDHCFFKYEQQSGSFYIHPDECATTNRGLNYKGDFKDTDNLRNRDNVGRGLIQFYNGTSNTITPAALLTAPTISNVDLVSSKVTVSENNSLPAGYNIRYTFSTGTPTDPVATSAIMPSDGLTITEDGILKVVIERYGLVLTEVATKYVEPTNKCAKPVIAKGDHVFTISCDYPTSGVTIYYTTNDETTEEQLASEPNTYGSVYPAGGVSFTDYDFTVKAVATAEGYITSRVATQYIGEDLTGEGTADNPYLIRNDNEFSTFVGTANSSDGAPYHYKLMANISGGGEITKAFTGTFEAGADAEGNFYKISGLSHALFNSIDGGTVKNVMLDNVSINVGTNAGAICNEAIGDSRIFNCGVLATNSVFEADKNGYTVITSCSSTIGGNGYVGGIVGLLDGSSRVINCFSYANITGGDKVGGIVGWNNVATNANSEDAQHYLKTMVMNCMFYGDITGGTSKAPIYNGEIITNDGDADGVNNFNYFWAGASYVQEQKIDNARYNCALAAETRFLQRFEFFRHLLNSNRELAAWWATGSYDNKDEMMKWVLEPSQIGTAKPYPILKAPDRYPSVVNIDVNHSETYNGRDLTVGPKLGSTLSVTIRNSTTDAVYGAPTGANITTASLSLNIMGKDPGHFNFNYGKVQLPYYNDVGTKNYTGNRVVTGWKIVSISDGTTDYSTDNDAIPADAEAEVDANGNITLTTPYNFADRKCTQKDLYGTGGSNRVFSQGAYWDVPEGVTAITIEPYWGKAVYLSDAYWDVTYKNGTGTDNTKAGSTIDAMTTAVDVTSVGGGQHYSNGVSTFNGQLVYTSMSNAIASSGSALYSGVEGDPNDQTVYDYAVVLVGNYHHNGNLEASNSKPYTVTSVDLDGDNEPDYSYILRFNGRLRVHPVRIDFLNAIGLGMAQKSTGGTGTYNFGIMQPKGWFESTNTSVFRFTQFEYDYADDNWKAPRANSPMILQGGVIEQWVTVGGSEQKLKAANSVTYYHVGGNVWFKEFHLGVHQDKTQDEFVTPHPPISVTGGDYDEFYLTGLYNTPNANYDDNAECYINGGRFGKVAGTGMQGIGGFTMTNVDGKDVKTSYSNGNIIWQIDNADIDEFYAGGINAAHIAEGNIYTVITNSRVDQFCGGPKFGNMNSDKKVVTNAENCTFRAFFGAGYGGNSYNRRYPSNQNNKTNINWNSWLTGTAGYDYSYDSDYGGVETRIDYQFLPMSSNILNVARLFVDYVSFSLATTHDVTSKLTGCTITTSSLGRLSISDDYKCLGNFYGGGSLGMVDGPVKSTLTNCTVEGNVFGGGYSATLPTVKVMNQRFQTEPYYDLNLGAYLEAELPATETYTWQHRDEVNSTETAIDQTKKILYTTENLTTLGKVEGNVTLTIDGNTTLTDGKVMSVAKSVYGGGEESNVAGNTQVNITGGTITQNVFGGGKGEADNFLCDKAMVGDNDDGKCADPGSTDNKDKGTIVSITNGTVNGNVYGGGEVGRVEWNTQVKIGIGTGTGTFAPEINGSVFGAGKGKETHGYAALVRGNSTVTIGGSAKVRKNVYGGGEQATVGRYWVKGITTTLCPGDENETEIPAAPGDLPNEMPYKTRRGGKSTVIIQGSAQIGPDDATGVSKDAGQVFGAGKGVEPQYVYNTGNKANWSRRMVDYNSSKHTSGEGGNKGQTWDYSEAYTDAQIADVNFKKYVWEYFVTEDKYFEFLQSLALVTGTDVTINGGTVKGNVYGGSESGFVQDDTDVKIQAGEIGTSGTTTYGHIFGGGKGLESFAEAGKVKGNTEVAISGNNTKVNGNVYGGGELGDVGLIDKSDKKDGKPTYNYAWKQTDGTTANVAEYNNITGTNNNTGICKVTITGGTIGSESGTTADHASGHVFGAGRGSETTWWCEKAIVFATNVSVSGSTVVYGNVYGGGQVGRVEDDGKVTIGTATDTGEGSKPNIKGDVFGAGAGLETHGYSALLRGNATVTVQGIAQVGGNVYGGGEIASVGKFTVVGGLPKKPDTGGTCIVNIKDNAKIGKNDTDDHNVFGACKGVTPHYNSSNYKSVYSMQTYENRPSNTPGDTWDYYVTYDEGYTGQKFIKRYYKSEKDYLAFLKTLALTSNPHVTIGGTWTKTGETESITPSGTPTVYGSVYGGGQRGVALGNVDVNMVGGTVEQDVYGGGALADTNLGNWDVNGYVVATALNEGESITDLYEKTGTGTTDDPYEYTKITDSGTTFVSGTYYRQQATWAHDNGSAYYTTTVDLTGGTVKGDAYGGGLGDLAAIGTGHSNIMATVYGDISVNLGKDGEAKATVFNISYYDENSETDLKESEIVKSGRVFGSNNLNGSPQGNVTVTVYSTGGESAGSNPRTAQGKLKSKTDDDHHYQVSAVYGGGNLANYEPSTSGKKANVIIKSCANTSILTVYGGGNAAAVPETDVDIYGAYEIGAVFGGGNGKDPYTLDNGATWNTNSGANVNGNANTMLYGGLIHEAFGGSNEKGTITGNVSINTSKTGGDCTLDVGTIYGAGKNADIDGDLIMVLGCKTTETEAVYGGAENANVKGKVELTITSGKFGRVFGGNNTSGAIFGSITLNIMESGCSPIEIDELYGGGYLASYSIYGYYVKTSDEDGIGNVDETAVLKDGKLQFVPRVSADDPHLPVKSYTLVDPVANTWTWEVYPISGEGAFTPYDDPVVNIVAATSIGQVFGGGYGEGAVIYGSPTVNINQTYPLKFKSYTEGTTIYEVRAETLGEIGADGVFGGGNQAKIVGNTTINIGTEPTVNWTVLKLKGDGDPVLDDDGKVISQTITATTLNTVRGANIVGNVYGGGNKADVTGNTFVNICAVKSGTTYSPVAEGDKKVKIAGNVFGGGKGVADNFLCDKAMVGTNDAGLQASYSDGNTSVIIGNGTVNGNVYGGGQIGRVEMNTTVTVGLPGAVTSSPDIKGDIFGGGMGDKEHGYAGLVRGNPTVAIQANAKVEHNVYGGGEIASVARYQVVGGVPVALAGEEGNYSGYCTVNVLGNAIIGPDEKMVMHHVDAQGNTVNGSDGFPLLPDDAGHVFAAGKGVLPKIYTYADNAHRPKRMLAYNDETISKINSGEIPSGHWEYSDAPTNKNIWQYFKNETQYFEFIQTLALATQTAVTVDGNAFVKGSVYGGSQNGLVQYDTHVTIDGNCQIGCGKNTTDRHPDAVWGETYTVTEGTDLECASWEYDPLSGAPYDPYAKYLYNGKYYYDEAHTKYAEGGSIVAKDGHTYYGNVFGGGSGSVPYFDTEKGISRYIPTAGEVKRDTYVTISGGHILTNVYGGNEATNVLGTAHVTMTGGTIGVPRTPQQIKDHPVTCYLFGAGKGDQRIFFNKETNVKDAIVAVEGGRIYGSVFGGGEDGHVLRNTEVNIGKAGGTGPKIGTVGSTYVDGNVFGGGRGFSGEALTAGNVGGSVALTINGGEMLGSIYGGGRLASVGYGLYLVDEEVGGVKPYGKMREDDEYDGSYPNPSPEAAGTFYNNGRGHITVTVNGGTIGKEFDSDVEGEHSGNVFGGSMGRLTKLDGSSFDDSHWPLLATAKSTTVNINGGTIKRSVYGGGEMGTVTTNATVNVSGGTIGTSGKGGAEFGNVYGGGKGYVDDAGTYATAGIIKGNTKVTINSGTNGEPKIYHNIYGGGAYGSVGTITYGNATYIPNQTAAVSNMPTAWERAAEGTTQVNTGTAEVYVYGGIIGTNGKENGMVFGSSRGDVGTPVNGIDPNNRLAWVYDTKVVIGGEGKSPIMYGSVYGSGENGHVFYNTQVEIHNGTIGVTADDSFGGPNYRLRGNVYGGGCGEDTYPGTTGTTKEDFNPLAGIVLDTTKVMIDGGQVVHNVYGAGALGSATNTSVTIAGNAVIGVSGKDGGNVFGAARGKEGITIVGSNLANSIETAVNINGGQILGSVYGGGETGNVKQDVNVSMTGGAVAKDVYGGGALAHTQTANWDMTNATWLADKISTAPNGKTTTTYKTHVSLTGGTITGDAYGGALGRKAVDGIAAVGIEGQDGYTPAVPAVTAVEAMVYGDVLVELNGKTTMSNGSTSTTIVGDNAKGCIVNRVFGCNNLNGTPKGKVKVYVYATQKNGESDIITKADKNTNTYDVQAVYGGGNLAAYEPVDATLEYNDANKARVDAAYPEVVIDGCKVTSIKQVYGGGNAAPVPATYVEVRRAYEIDEVFGGGNGYDNYSVEERGQTVWYQNPGANVGYYDYTHTEISGSKPGTEANPYYLAVEDTRYAGGADHKEARLAAKDIQYGSGIARLEVKGGTIHTSYGGSNSKGNVRAKLSSAYSAMFDDCEMQVAQSYGGGKNAYSDAETDMVADCAKGVKEMFGGAKDADMDGDINMLITNGSSLQRVFGGNNTSGAVNGSITITLEEGGCEPIKIGELYAGGFLAPYSVYGYEKNEDGSYKTESVKYLDENNVEQTKLQRIPLESGTRLYKDPRINVISATSIGNIFGGGYQAKLVGNPHINVNMTTGFVKVTKTLKAGTADEYIYKDVAGNEYAAEKVSEVSSDPSDPEAKSYIATTDLGTIGNIYGGGNMADIVGDTYVEIGTGTEHNDAGELVAITPARNGAKITGNVFGGGKGVADHFECKKAMVGVDNESDDENKRDGGTHVIIGNGTVGTLDSDGKLIDGTGNVYGGGQLGRVERNTMVTIGLGDGTENGEKTPIIYGCVFGAGSGINTHGYAALVRGNSTVIVQGNAWVQKSVYGGGEIATVGKYALNDAGLPTSPVRGGLCTVTVKGWAEVGPDNMQMKKAGGPDDTGYVFGACKGVLPYEGYTDSQKPQHMDGDRQSDGTWTDHPKAYKAFGELTLDNNVLEVDNDYMAFINTLALATTTEVTIGGHAFVKGSVYGGSENGHVQSNTHVTIEGDCQIGNGDGENRRYTPDEWAYDGSSDAKSLKECASWDYGKKIGTDTDGKDIMEYLTYDVLKDSDSDDTPDYASDGHTFYGNVFGGGSGYFPYHRNHPTALAALKAKDAGYADGLWHREAGSVGGSTVVDITGGHILTSVYGGNECTDVAGSCTINMVGGTVGVPRTVEQAKDHPVTCYVFGAGKGDQRINFNSWTNVASTQVNISGNARIYGSTFGGGEDGHVLGNVETNIGGTVEIDLNGDGDKTDDGETFTAQSSLKIGTTGTSGVDGNIFGGGRGFSETALTAGVVCGNVTVNIHNGKMLGSVFGGGRLASVGTHLVSEGGQNYGKLIPDGKNQVIGGDDVDASGVTHGHIAINIDGGIIGATDSNGKLLTSMSSIGDVFGGCKGSGNNKKFGLAKLTEINMTGGTVNGNVFGGGELGYVGEATYDDETKVYTWNEESAGGGRCTVGISGGTVAGNVFGAGKGKDDTFECEKALVRTTNVAVSDGKVGGNVYGGGEVGRVDQNSAVTIGPATGDSTPTITGSVFGAGAGVETHGYSALVRGNTAVIVQGNAKVGNSVYGGGQIAAVGRYGLDGSGMPSTLVSGGECVVTVQGNAVIGTSGIGNVFGAGMGVDESKKTYTYADNANRPKRMMTYASGLYTDANKALWEFSDATHTYVWEYFDTKTKYLNFLQTLALATDTRLTVNGNASVKGSVYGGSESGFVQRDTEVKILGGEILTIKDAAGNITEGNVFGGGKGISDNDVAGRVRSDTRITVLDGTINGDVYGGGALGKANTFSATNTTIVNLLGGTIKGDVFGGGLGNATTAADVGNTVVNLNGMTTEELNSFSGDFKTLLNSTLTGLKEFTKKGAVVKGNVFGANNVNGTPKGHVLVHVHGTQNETTSALNAKVDGLYDVTGVFGGGNASDYVPDAADTKQSTEVIIEGCDLTSIEEVYGGGYGAATPGTNVLIKGTKIINNVFGGGYGAGTDNPGANVGYRTVGKTLYGSHINDEEKIAIVQLMAGTVNNVYGGSNTKGDIRSGSNVTNVANDNSPGCCTTLSVQEIYGGGSQADMFGGTEIVLGCMPNDWIGAIYAGAENANVGNDVSLTLTSGKFGRVFGGNKSGGTIDGYIEVNIEENPECSTPIIIGGLYGGGNEAPYTTPARYFTNNPNYQSPRVNVRAFTSIGNIYGGGFGASATVTGNPLVNINEVQGGREYAGEDKPLEDGTTVKLYARKADGKMGVIGNVFGGGNAAKVIGNTNVMIGTEAEQEMESLKTTDATTGTVTVVKKPVLGADIQGNVYGAGNNAEVTGHTNVVIGKKAE